MHSNRVSPVLVSLAPLLTLALASCGSTSSPGGSSVTQTIGPEGGMIAVDGATVTFPPNALAAPTTVTITPTDEPIPAGYVAFSRLYRCAPSGTTFAKPVTMAMGFHGDPATARMFWSSGVSTTFKDVGGSASGSVMSAQVQHFSGGFVGMKQ